MERFEKDKVLHTLGGHALNAPPAATFSLDGQSVVTGRANDSGVWLWNAADGKQVRRLATSAGVYSIRYLPGGDRIVFAGTISNDANIHLHEVATGNELLPPMGHLTAR